MCQFHDKVIQSKWDGWHRFYSAHSPTANNYSTYCSPKKIPSQAVAPLHRTKFYRRDSRDLIQGQYSLCYNYHTGLLWCPGQDFKEDAYNIVIYLDGNCYLTLYLSMWNENLRPATPRFLKTDVYIINIFSQLILFGWDPACTPLRNAEC